jgi:hypothetical protein
VEQWVEQCHLAPSASLAEQALKQCHPSFGPLGPGAFPLLIGHTVNQFGEPWVVAMVTIFESPRVLIQIFSRILMMNFDDTNVSVFPFRRYFHHNCHQHDGII